MMGWIDDHDAILADMEWIEGNAPPIIRTNLPDVSWERADNLYRWDVAFGARAINLNPTLWQRCKAHIRRRVELLRDARDVLTGKSIAVDAGEYYAQEDF